MWHKAQGHLTVCELSYPTLNRCLGVLWCITCSVKHAALWMSIIKNVCTFCVQRRNLSYHSSWTILSVGAAEEKDSI